MLTAVKLKPLNGQSVSTTAILLPPASHIATSLLSIWLKWRTRHPRLSISSGQYEVAGPMPPDRQEIQSNDNKMTVPQTMIVVTHFGSNRHPLRVVLSNFREFSFGPTKLAPDLEMNSNRECQRVSGHFTTRLGMLHRFLGL